MKLVSVCKSPILCAVAVVFITASVWMSFAVDKHALTSSFFQVIGGKDTLLGKKYMSRIHERRSLYFQGLVLGALLSVLYLWTVPSAKSVSVMKHPLTVACMVSGITMLTAYFYYMLMPKQPMLVLELTNEKQRSEWANIYKTMQWNYHAGLLLGVIGVGVFGFGVAKQC